MPFEVASLASCNDTNLASDRGCHWAQGFWWRQNVCRSWKKLKFCGESWKFRKCMFWIKFKKFVFLEEMRLFYVWVHWKGFTRIEIMLGGFHLVLNHHLGYSHVTDWRRINDKAHRISGHACAKRPLFISCTCYTKNSVIKFRWFPSDVYQKTICLCASSHEMTSNVLQAWVCCKAARTRTLDRCGWKMAAYCCFEGS